MKVQWKRFGLIALSSVWITILGGCSETTVDNRNETIALARNPVEVMIVEPKGMTEVSELSGTLEPIEETILSFEVAGQIQNMSLEEGDPVKKGELVASLDSTDYSLQSSLASIDVSRAQATLTKVQNGSREQEKAQARTALEAKQINVEKVKKDYFRMEELYQSGAISLVDYENAKRAWDLAQKEVDAAQETYSLILEGARPEDLASTEAAYQAALVNQSQAAHMLEKTKLKSPVSGTIISKLAGKGQLTGIGSPIYRVGNIDQLKLVLPVPDKEVKSWNIGDSVEVKLYEQKRIGKVNKIHPITNQQTGTIQVEVIIENPKHDWFSGQVASAKKTLSKKEGIFIPTQAVLSRGEDPFVFKAVEDKAVKTPVTLGSFMNGVFEITSGLNTGDQVIILGADVLLDGDPVRIQGEGNDD